MTLPRSGETSDILANGNADGHFYIEVLPTDTVLDTDRELVALENTLVISEFLTEPPPGTYIVGRDIRQALYSREADTGVLDICYWEGLSGVSGDFTAIIGNHIASGQYFVQVSPSDFAVTFGCAVVFDPPFLKDSCTSSYP